MSKKCTKCKKALPLNMFSKWKKGFDGVFPSCKECRKAYNREYYLRNTEAIKQRAKKYKKGHRKRANEICSRDRLKLKLEMIEAYGGKCTCCGESNYKFLALDHVNNDGNIHRKKLAAERGIKKVRCDTIWREARRNNFPDSYTILCMNCNYAKSAYGICPHKL